MKKTILCIALVLSGLTAGAYAKGSLHTPQNTSVTVVSDTTGTDDATEDAADANADPASFDSQMDSAMQSAFGIQNPADADDAGMHVKSEFPFWDFGSSFVITVLLIIFGLPILLVALILYFIFRNKKEKYNLQKAAIEKGLNPNTVLYTGTVPQQPEETVQQQTKAADGTNYMTSKIPTQAMLNEKLWEQGIKQMCLGAGLALVLGFIVDGAFSLIGVLVLFIGLGKVIIARSRRNNTVYTNYDYNEGFNRPYNTQPKEGNTQPKEENRQPKEAGAQPEEESGQAEKDKDEAPKE